MTKNIVILVNPKSGKAEGVAIANTIATLLDFKELVYKMYTNNWVNNLAHFTEVWVIGGDGTINYFLNKYPDCAIPIAFFKAGTGNDFAWMLYGNISIENQVEIVLNIKGKFVDVGKCNSQLFANGVGIGFDGEILKSMGSIRWLGGHLGYLYVVIKKIFSFKENHFKIDVDGVKKEGHYFLMSVFNAARTGGGFNIAPKALIHDGRLDVVLCKPLSIKQRLLNLSTIEKGKHLGLPFIDFSTTKKITIECDKILAAQIDGELIFANKFVFEVISNKYQFLY